MARCGEYNWKSRNGEGRQRRPLNGPGSGMLAQYPNDVARAVEAAVYLHGLAADMRCVRQMSTHCWLRTVSTTFTAFRFNRAGRKGMFGCRGHCTEKPPVRFGMSNATPPAEGRIQEFTTQSGADTIEVGRKLARLLKAPQLLILRGNSYRQDHAGEGDCAGA